MLNVSALFSASENSKENGKWENQSTYAQRDTPGLTSRLNKPQYMVGKLLKMSI